MDQALLQHLPGYMRRIALIAFALTGGCVTPSIPIPPPDPSQMDFVISTPPDGPSTAVLTYPPDQNYEGGTAYLFNHDTGGGVFHLVNPDFSVGPLGLEAKAGDQIVFTVESTDQTVSRCVVLQQGTQDPNTYCSF
jgi:hypothetical protein